MMASTVLAPTAARRPDWLPQAVWPFEPVAIDVDGTTIAVTDVGRGPALLFYTGIGSFVWRDVIVRLSRDFRCVSLDPPGIGLSAPARRSDTTLQRSAHAVEAVVRALQLGSLTLVVHDTAGPPAFAAAARIPQRIAGIVAVNSFGWRPSGAAFRGMLALMGSSLMRRIDVSTGVLPRLTATAFGVGRHLDAASRRAYHAGLRRNIGAFHDYLGDARRAETLYDEIAAAFDGPLGRLPLLTIFGERNDPLGFQRKWRARFPRARQVVVPKGNHFPMCDDPDLVANQIRAWHHEFVGRRQEGL
jgi:haloalkane dehalogenase